MVSFKNLKFLEKAPNNLNIIQGKVVFYCIMIMETVLYCPIMIMYAKYEFVLGLISVGDFPSINLGYNLQISKCDIKMHISSYFLDQKML